MSHKQNKLTNTKSIPTCATTSKQINLDGILVGIVFGGVDVVVVVVVSS
jgi:hypothetical protein